MNKEEYEKLLQSDYWKGYSFSLIKERNFTCQDCGRTFYNERNKLQVHHLVYRDANPWSYKPEELIVLCEDCHKRRHGIIPENEPIYDNRSTNTNNDRFIENTQFSREWVEEPSRNKNYILFVFAAIVLFLLWLGFNNPAKTSKRDRVEQLQQVVQDHDTDENNVYKPSSIKQSNTTMKKSKESEKGNNESEEVTANSIEESTGFVEDISASSDETSYSQKSTSEILRDINHTNVVKEARRVGVSTEGSTSEILSRINHANVVKEAERVGVSTEGSTSEILSRINHANVVKEAERVGVSTEGTTTEILSRINRKNMENLQY